MTPALLESLHFDGASYVVGTTDMFDSPERQQNFREILTTFPVIVSNDRYFILRLTL